MPKPIPYIEKKPAILRALRERAPRGERVSYGRLGKLVDIPTQGPWKPVLDQIANEEEAQGRPDITYLVVLSGTGYPAQIERKDSRKPTERQRQAAERVWNEIRAYYATERTIAGGEAGHHRASGPNTTARPV